MRACVYQFVCQPSSSLISLQQLQSVTKEDPAALLRVEVDGGGCSGFQYKFSLDNNLKSDDK